MEIPKLTLATLALSGVLLFGCGEDESAQSESADNGAGNESTSSEMTTGTLEPADPAEEGAPVVPEDEVGTAADVPDDSEEAIRDPVEPMPENTTSGQGGQDNDSGEEDPASSH